MERVENDELSIKNYKNALTILSFVSLCISVYNAKDIITIFPSTFTFFASNLLTFHVIDSKSAEGQGREKKLIKIYIGVITFMLAMIMIGNNVTNSFFISFMLYSYKAVIVITGGMAPYYAIKDDRDYEPPEVDDARKRTRKKIDEEKKNKPFSTKKKNTQLNQNTKEFLETTDNKAKREGRRV